MNKSTWVYGGVMGVLLIVLQSLNYRTLIKDISLEVYGGIIAILFLAVGIWLGSVLIKRVNEGTLFSFVKSKEVGLSNREAEVLQLMTEGLSNQEIADRLFVSMNTIKTHTSNIYVKLHVKRRTQAVQKASELQLIHTLSKN
ncbi:MAG: DNA-binding response regulator [Cyclobacteriaceae bacterium]|nr:DNA-binding response regulator [Cyclobacteriaceae bacterium HetDA_MAG_MS6]